MFKILFLLFLTVWLSGKANQTISSINQTPTVDIPLPEDSLPYRLRVKQADFSLPSGVHSFVYAVYKDEWVIMAGRTNGIHLVDVTSGEHSFPKAFRNTTVHVINSKTKKSYSRSILGPSTGLSTKQVNELAVTNALYYQPPNSKTLYIVGGYIHNEFGKPMSTASVLTAVDIPNLIEWVKHPNSSKKLVQCIRQTSHPLLQLTGGDLYQSDSHQPYLLAFGQNFTSDYILEYNGIYSKQIRPFQIIDTGKYLYIQPSKQPPPIESYRRRDLNVVPIIKKSETTLVNAFVALAGVFKKEMGSWTVPIEINQDGSSFMPDPTNPSTLKQGMNIYNSAHLGLFSKKTGDMYTVLFGGFSYLIQSDGTQASCTSSPPVNTGVFTCCPNFPSVNDITTVRIDPEGNYQQYLMSAKFPTIPTVSGSSPGGPTWFGAEAVFIPDKNMPTFSNGVISLDNLGSSPIRLGYIVGGIANLVTETVTFEDSMASHYIFEVILEPR